MKLAIQFSLRELASLSDDQLRRLGLRGLEVPVSQADAELPVDLKPCVFDSLVVLGRREERIKEDDWRRWFRRARDSGAQGVAAAVHLARERAASTLAIVEELSDLALEEGSRLLLTTRSDWEAAQLTSYAPLIAWCERRDGRGLGLILDVEAAGLLGDEPRRLLREAQGYVQHVRVPSPAWRRADQGAVFSVLQELQRLSYIDYVALFGKDDPVVPMAEAIDALRQTAVRAWG